MRHLYLAMTAEEVRLSKSLRFMLNEGMELMEAALECGISVQRARFIVQKSQVTREQLVARRKKYIVTRVTNKKSGHRHTPHVISRYFECEESYVRQLMRDLRAEGRLPPLTDKDQEWKEDVIRGLSCHFARVYSSKILTAEERKKLGKKEVYVDTRGWLTWAEASNLLIATESSKACTRRSNS